MKNFILLIITLIVALPFTGCLDKPEPATPVVTITLSTESLQFPATGGQKTFTVASTADWTLTGYNAVCVVSPWKGVKNQTVTVSVTLPANESSERTFSLTIQSGTGTATKTVAVTQDATQYANNVSEIAVTQFGIFPANNEKIYSPVVFVTQNGANYDFNGTQSIRYYKTDLTALKASWASNATKVTIGSTAQTSGVTANNFTGEITYRFYAKDNNYKEFKVKITNPADSYSGLPILVLTTDDGADIRNKEDWQMGRFVFDAQGNAGVSSLTGVTEIRGRGNSTWGMAKKPYALKLNKKAEGTFGGMNPHKRWAVLANYADKTGIRNRVAFEIGKHTRLAWTPDSRFVEVILNGKFLGNYLLTEQIKRDPNRVNIQEIENTETDPERITGGWLMEIDRYYSIGETRYFRPTISQLPIIVKDPEDANTAQMNYIQNYFDDVEKLIYPGLPAGTPYHAGNAHLAGTPDSLQYHQYIDITSFIDYWIVQEVVGNRDGRLPGSVYMYKDVKGKLCAGPLWDFDQTTFLGDREWLYYDYVPSEVEYADPAKMRTVWYPQLFKDPKFKARAKQRWNELYPYLSTGVTAFMDQEYARIAKSLEINWVDAGEDASQGIWPLSEGEMQTGGRNHDKNLPSADAVARMKTRYLQRLTWLNTQISRW